MSFKSDDQRKHFFANEASGATFGGVVRSVASAVGIGFSLPSKTASPAESFLATVKRYDDFVRNPTDEYSTEKVKKILDWGIKQEARLTAAVHACAKDDYDRMDEISDIRFEVRMMNDKARSCIEGDESWKDSAASL